jgi:4-hydroxy-3-methylbut-2-en-1-yl diphosphate reductase
MQVFLANPRGFCAGVDRAIEIVERAIELFGKPIYVRHEVVHNKHVVDRLRELGAIFVEELREVPPGSTVIFSAHGVSTTVEKEAKTRGLTVFDATCPLVTKVHMEVQRYAREGRDVILIGHDGHPEVEGTMGRFDTSFGGRMHLVQNAADAESLHVHDPSNLAFVTQTTLSVDDTAEIVNALRRRFPCLATPRKEDICYATQNRQDAVKVVAPQADVVLVIGSKNSSNSNRLAELSAELGTPAHLVDDETSVDPAWLDGASTVGLTSGASAPDWLVHRMLGWLAERGFDRVEEVTLTEERVRFSLPAGVREIPLSAN